MERASRDRFKGKMQKRAMARQVQDRLHGEPSLRCMGAGIPHWFFIGNKI